MSAEETRRLTPTERLHEVTMAFASRQAAAPEHTVDLTRNAKGNWQVAIAVRGHDIDQVYAEAKRIAREADTDFPFENGGAT